MPQSTNLNKAPYFDDFEQAKNFYRVLFRPGYSIQARELTTLQSILQSQLENFAKSKYKQGSVVVPGEIIYDDTYNYVKISSFTNNLAITDYIGKQMTGGTSGLVATVVNATPATTTHAATLFVKYENSGTSGVATEFTEGETLTANSPGNPTAIVGINGTIIPTDTPAVGQGSAVSIREGVYFINGTFVRTENQTVILDKYGNTPSYKVGFVVSETLVTPEEDFSLLDNAQGYSNFTAPGAHRLKITVTLDKRDVDFPEQKDFVQLLLIQGGVIRQTVETQENTFFEDILARRTFDESGDYVVRDFSIGVRQHLDDGSNNGVFTSSQGGDEAKFVAEMSPGKAYVRGYEIETTSSRYVEVDKARDTNTESGVALSISEGSNFTVRNLYGFPDFEKRTQTLTSSGTLGTNSYQEINLYANFNDLLFGDTAVNSDTTAPQDELFCILTLKNISNLTASVPAGSAYQTSAITGEEVRYYSLSATDSFATVIVTKPSSDDFSINELITIFGSSTFTARIASIERISTPYIGIAKTKYLKFLTGTSTSGIYNKATSSFKLGVFNTEYFTKIQCKEPVNFFISGNFASGRFIEGQTSGARGVLETYVADTKEIVVSNVTGNFAPGETITCEVLGTTTPVNYIEDEGTIAYFKPIAVGSGYTTISGVATATISIDGIDKTSVIGASNISVTSGVTSGELTGITITDAARESLGSYSTPPIVTIAGGNSASYIAVLNKNTVMNYDSSFIRSFYGFTVGNYFSGDISSRQDPYIITNGNTYSATEGSYFISADNLGSRPDLDLVHNDVIEVVNNDGSTSKYLVKFASREGNSATARIYVYGAVENNFTTKTISRIRSRMSGVNSDTNIIPFSNKNIKTAVLNPTSTGINYTVQREFLGNLDGSGSTTVTVGTNESFLGFSNDNYILTDLSTGNIIDLSGTGAVTIGGSSGSVTINVGASFANIDYKLIAPVFKTNTIPKTKTLVTDHQQSISADFANETIALQYADGYRLKAVYMSSSSSPATVTDAEITDRFIFDGGQRESYYDLARIIRKPGTPAPTQNILVVFDYFNHIGSSSTGDYFTVDSYTNIDYEDIPSFNSSVHGTVSLRDVVDFRPRVSNYTGLASASVVPGYVDFPSKDATEFDATGSSFASPPIYGTSFATGYEYYLNRIDAIYIAKNGQFVVSRGNPSLNPQLPSTIDEAILLYHLNIPAYTGNLTDIQIKSFDNRRYTMRDIGKLEKRIEKLEYYTTLSLLEQDTLNSQVRDEFGNERFRNGIIVDNFEGHGIGDTLSQDYTCSIDTQTGILRPSFYASQTTLKEVNNTTAQRSADGYSKTGDIVSLPYTEQSAVVNPFATRSIPINPGRASRYCGIMSLDPSIDEWRDTVTPPELIVNENAVFDTIRNVSVDLWGSLWNEWQISWTGTPTYNLSNSTNFANTSAQFGSTTSNIINATNRTRTRNGTQNRLSPYGSITNSVGQRVVSSAYNPYARSRIVSFVARGLEPNTRLYAFFDGIDINDWVNPDDVTSSTTPFTGVAGYAEKGFGATIVTDSNGNISGQFLVPNGYAPIAGKTIVDYTTALSTFYRTSGTERRFPVGTKVFRLTSSATNTSNSLDVTTFVESEYVVSGAPETSIGNIQSTRVPSISRRSVSNSDTVQFVGTNRVNVNQSGLLDPLSQTFSISGFDEGLFLTSVDLYFANKLTPSGTDSDRPVSIYLTETSGGIPTRRTLPFSEVSMNPDTVIRFRITTDVPLGVVFPAGSTVTGRTSGATATIKTSLTVTSANTRYNLVLNEHNGISFIAGEELTLNVSPGITSTTFFIDLDAGIVDSIKVTNFGSGYVSGATSITITGDNGGAFGTAATAVANIYNGLIHTIQITNPGFGYYTAPTVTITGGDGLASAVATLKITNPAVKMGIATSTDATIKTTFKFPSPVYLENNSSYALVVTSSSSDYTIYSSRVGDALLSSTVTASNQPNVGSIFKSQNSSAWTEDENEDIKFTLNRAVFSTSATATVELANEDLGTVILPNDPISADNTLGSSSLFGANQKILRIFHPNHGMQSGDVVVLSGIRGIGTPENIFGIPVSIINGMHNVFNVGIDHYCILIPTALWDASSITMTGSGNSGGNFVRATTNKLYEIIQSQVYSLAFPSSTLSHAIRTAKGKPVDSTITNQYTLDTAVNINPGENYYFDSTKVIASPNNEVYYGGSTRLNGNRSLTYTLSMQTSRDNVSPIIDLKRANVITVGSRIDQPIGTESRFGAKSQSLTLNNGSFALSTSVQTVATTVIEVGTVTGGPFNITANTSTSATNGRVVQATTGATGQIVSVETGRIRLIDVAGTFNATDTLLQGSISATPTSVVSKSGIIIGWDPTSRILKVKLTSENTFSANDFINDDAAGTSPVTARTITAASDTKGYLFIPETNIGSSSVSKYLTKEVVLDTPGEAIDCRITANLFNNSDIKVMYKIKPDGSSEDFNRLPWNYFNSTGLSDNSASIIPSDLRTLSPNVEDLSSYIEYLYTANNLTPFRSFAIKIVFTGNNPALAPRIEDLRVIAHS